MQNIVLEQGRKFTFDTYATKEEVKAVYNSEDINDIWKNILEFRQFYDFQTEMKDKDGYPFKICLFPSLLAKADGLKDRLIKDLFQYMALSDELKREFDLETRIQALDSTSKTINVNANHDTLKRIATNEMENIYASMYLLKAYNDALDHVKSEVSISKHSLMKINCILCGEKEENISNLLRKNEIRNEVLNPLNQISPDKIEKHLDFLLSFLNQKEIPLLLRALCIPYFFLSVRPFEYNNETTAAIFSKSFLSQSILGPIGFSLDIESICFSTTDRFFMTLKQSETSLDLTYILNRFLAFEEKREENISLLTKELSIRKISIHSPNKLYENDIPVKEDIRFAMPVFQKENTLEEIEAQTRKLLELYPQLKRKQAHFYAGHCQVGLHYTIEQFKEEEKTVYETARTSMEDLSQKGFYKKELIGKKFVYTPMIKDENQG